MVGKIFAAATAGIVLLSAGVASAQPVAQAKRAAVSQTPVVNVYYDKAYWDGIAGAVPSVRPERPNPYAGTVWENVVPY